MKNITLSADDHVIAQARKIAHSRHKTLNAEFREWLAKYTAQNGSVDRYDALMARLSHIDAGRKFSREEMNER